jgi:hypothetical protein
LLPAHPSMFSSTAIFVTVEDTNENVRQTFQRFSPYHTPRFLSDQLTLA